jgi:cysteine desulfurase/selenocysteine lyase
VGLAIRSVADAYHAFVSEWMTDGLDFVRGEAAAENARSSVAALMGADRVDIALIPSVSAAAGLVAAQLGQATGAENVVIGEQEYSSNHFPWRQLTTKGYEVRQVPFRNGGLEPEALARHVDAGTRLVAFSGVQSATGHRSDIAAISALAREVGAMVFVDASQMLGAMTIRSAGWRRWESRPHSRRSTSSARTRSMAGPPSSRPFSDQPSAMRVGRR